MYTHNYTFPRAHNSVYVYVCVLYRDEHFEYDEEKKKNYNIMRRFKKLKQH